MSMKFPKVWSAVHENYSGGPYSCHGIDHWKRVHRNARILARKTGADLEVIELFAAYHDSCRLSDGYDPEHSLRGAQLAKAHLGRVYSLDDDALFQELYIACQFHTDQHFHENPTIATCWDADRLDLGRVGVIPSPEYLNSDYAKQLCMEPGLDFVLSELGKEP